MSQTLRLALRDPFNSLYLMVHLMVRGSTTAGWLAGRQCANTKPNIPAFVVCTSVSNGARSFVQELVFTHSKLMGTLKNVPNWDVWSQFTDPVDSITIAFDPTNPLTCLVNNQ